MPNNKNQTKAVVIPQTDTGPGPGLRELDYLKHEDTDPLAALNAEKENIKASG